MIFLTPGEKVRKIRKQLGMTQLELEDVNLKRNFISMIENGDRFASKKTAKKLAEKFNRRSKELGIDLNVNEEYLLSSPREQAKEYCENRLLEIDDFHELDEIISIAKEYSLEDVELNVYLKKGNKYLDQMEYNEAFINFLRALDICKNVQDEDKQASIFNKLGVCKVEVGEYIEALEYYSKAYHYSTLYVNEKIERYSLYNISYAYSKLEKYDRVIEYCDDLLDICSKETDLETYVHANVLKSIAYRERTEVDRAIQLLDSLIPECTGNEELLGYIYNNLGSLYLRINFYEKSLEYYDEAGRIVELYDDYNIHGNMIDKAQVYIDMKRFVDAIELIEEGLKRAEHYNDIEYLLKGFYMLIELYKYDGNNKRAKKLCLRAVKTIEDKKFNIDKRVMYSRLALLYLEDNEIDKAKEYIGMSLSAS